VTSLGSDAAHVRCGKCGEPNPPHARFCHSCGARLDIESVAQEERKLVSVLFVDLEGFTASSDDADPEDVRDLLEAYHASAKACIEQYGGTVEKFIGDAVMAIFGAPVAHGDDAERAVRAGLRVLEQVEGHGLSARAAVHTGEAVVRLAEQSSGEAIAMGDVVNTASRLQSHAPTGRVLVGDATFRSTRQAIRYEPHDAVAAKGKAEPVAAWLAVEILPKLEEDVPSAVAFVGRGRELELVRSVWNQAVSDRRPHVVTVLGSPGVGKSRLCREVAALVAADGGQVLRGRCLPYEETTGYHAFSQLVRQVAGIFDSDAPALAREKLASAVESEFPPDEAPSRLRDLALLLGLGAHEHSLEQGVLFFSARRLLERLGEERPTLVVVEDLHWAATSEVDLFEYLGAHVRETRVLFIALARPELLDTRPAWGVGSGAQARISLEPLPGEVAVEMAVGLLPDADAETIERLVGVAEGNPLFIEELVAATVEQGGADELPVTVRAVIAARIDALPPDARNALMSAAVIGRTFWQDVLRAVAGVDDLARTLDDLERRDLIRREPTSRLEGDVEFRFKHALIRDVAYGTLPRATRRERHAATARFVEERTDGAETVAWVLAHHWREAGEAEKAIPHLLTAATVAQQAWAMDAVHDLYSQALELAEDAPTTSRIRLRRAYSLIVLNEYRAALEDLEAILPEFEGSELLDALLYAGKAYVWTEQDERVIEMAERALELANELGDSDGEVAATALLSEGLAQRGAAGDIERAIELGDEALSRWRFGRREFERADHCHLHGDLMYWTGDYERSIELGAAAHELGGDVHSMEAMLRGTGLQAMALTGLGRHEEALAKFNANTDAVRELGRKPLYLLNYSSMVHRELNDLSVAKQESEEVLEGAPRDGFSMVWRFAQSDLLQAQLLEGDVGRAQADWPGLWEDAEQASAWTRWLIYGRLAAARAEIALHAETPEDAAEWAQTAIELAVSTRRRKYEAIARTTLGDAFARLGRREEALAEHELAVRIADRLIGQPARFKARAALARSAYALGDDERAALATTEGRKLVDDFTATLAPERADLVRASRPVRELFAS
jgi:class 3 adenylate cyclase/tetratricopeptide (TPR) repeat protein